MFLYLDTNFISQFAKADLGKLAASNAGGIQELLTNLRQRVGDGTIVCPASEFQLWETRMLEDSSPEFAFKCKEIMLELSKGYFLRYWEDILVHEAVNQVLIYMGRGQYIDLGWKAFIKQISEAPSAKSIREAKSECKKGTVKLYTRMPKSTLREQYQAERAAFINESFLQPIRRLLGYHTYSDTPEPFLSALICGARIKRDEYQKLLNFFESDQVDKIPFIKIFCSIEASIRVHERSRCVRESDLIDEATLATTFKYCDMITTDKNMKTHIVSRLHLDTEYGVQVFALTRKDIDRLLDKISRLSD